MKTIVSLCLWAVIWASALYLLFLGAGTLGNL